ncbi:hypothetical protein H0H93_000591 [Arthromyces matolae]|nr:hypothetical protein H0H93_000591 [Arthromyces matolae]
MHPLSNSNNVTTSSISTSRSPVPVRPRVASTSTIMTPPRKTLSSPSKNTNQNLTVSPMVKLNLAASPSPKPRTKTNAKTPQSTPSKNSTASTSTSATSASASQFSTNLSISQAKSKTGAMALWGGAKSAELDVSDMDNDNDMEDMDMELLTDPNDGDVDEELATALQTIQTLHTRKILAYKRLLERTHASTAAQLHALQAEIRLLRSNPRLLESSSSSSELVDDDGKCVCGARKRRDYWDGVRGGEAEVEDVEGAGEGIEKVLKRGFNEVAVRRALRKLGREERMRLVGVILDSCLPGDIPLQILLLTKYAKSTFDIVGTLSPELACRILRCLDVKELVGLRLVRIKDMEINNRASFLMEIPLFTNNTYRPRPITSTLITIRMVRLNISSLLSPTLTLSSRETLYRSLHHHEHNFTHALPQSIRFLQGHTGFVTSLLLRGKRLISGSYDETIRVWELSGVEGELGGAELEAKCVKVLSVKKPVSCVDFLVEEEIFVVGFHDVGRIHLYSSLTYTPLQQLAGHLNGIRAVALSSSNLVSAGADKALVCWDWRRGTKIVRFGQQTTVSVGVQIVGNGNKGEAEERREMISQFKLSELGGGDPVLNAKLYNVGMAPNNMLQWFAAKGTQMTCATKSVIIHLQWQEDEVEGHEGNNLTQNTVAANGRSLVGSPTSLSPSTPSASASANGRTRTTSSLSSSFGLSRSPSVLSSLSNSNSTSIAGVPVPTSTSGISTPIRRGSFAPTGIQTPVTPTSISGAGAAVRSRSRLSLNTGIPRTPTNVNLNGSVNGNGNGIPTPTRVNGTGSNSTSNTPVKLSQRAAILTAPPKIVGIVETPMDVAVGAVDPRKRRVVTATRFSSRAGAVREIFMTTHGDRTGEGSSRDPEYEEESGTTIKEDGLGDSEDEDDEVTQKRPLQNDTTRETVDITTDVRTLSGVWAAFSGPQAADGTVKGIRGGIPPKFTGLATPEKNPMSMQLSHEEVVVGVMSFLGHEYKREKIADGEDSEVGRNGKEEADVDDEDSSSEGESEQISMGSG